MAFNVKQSGKFRSLRVGKAGLPRSFVRSKHFLCKAGALGTRYTTVYLSAIHKRAKRNERSVAEFSGYLVSKLT